MPPHGDQHIKQAGAGSAWSVQGGDVTFSSSEYKAVREGAGLVDRPRGAIAVTGPDRASFLQGLLTNDVAALGPGTGCYAAYLTPHGRMIADVRVLELGDLMLLDVQASLTTGLVARLDDLIFSEDVQVADWTDRWIVVGVHGPHAAVALASALETNPAGDELPPTVEVLAGLAEYENRRSPFAGATLIIVRSDDYGAIGFDVYVPPNVAQSLRAALGAAGARAVGADTVEALRVEAGRPAFLIDMDEETIPLEAGLEDRAIHFNKGCYVGQELIIRILHRGHGRVAKKLVGLTIQAPVETADQVATYASRGDRIHHEGREGGRLTSVAFSPRLGGAIALGYVQRQFAEAGTRVVVEHADRQSEAVVTKLPFVLQSDRDGR